MSYLTNDEHRILLAALRREKEFCSRQMTVSKRLVGIVQSLERKFYYDRFEKEIRNKVIEEFTNRLSERIDTRIIDNEWLGNYNKVLELQIMKDEMKTIAEQMKEVGE